MMQRAKDLAGGVSLVLVMLAAGQAKAGQVTYSTNFILGYMGEAVYAVPQFDPGLGSLSGIQVAISSADSVGNVGEFFNLASPGYYCTQATVGAGLGASGPGFNYSDSPTTSQFVMLQPDARAYIYNNAQIDSGSYDIAPSYFGAYEGTGMTCFNFDIGVFSDSSNSQVTAITLPSGEWTGTVEVTYTYVPEPSSIAMLPIGIGFVIACVARRKKQRPGPRRLAGR
jgi:hypothetical protein